VILFYHDLIGRWKLCRCKSFQRALFKDPKSALWKLLHLQISVFSFYQVIKNIHMQYVICLNLLWKNKILLETLFQRSKRALLQNSVVTFQDIFMGPKSSPLQLSFYWNFASRPKRALPKNLVVTLQISASVRVFKERFLSLWKALFENSVGVRGKSFQRALFKDPKSALWKLS